MYKCAQVLQRGLPRPVAPPPAAARPAPDAARMGAREAAEALVAAELAILLAHDAAKYPLKERKKVCRHVQAQFAHLQGGA